MIDTLNNLVEENFSETKLRRNCITYGSNCIIGFFTGNTIVLYSYYKICSRILEKINEFEERGIQLILSIHSPSKNGFDLYTINNSMTTGHLQDLNNDIKYKVLLNTINYYGIDMDKIREHYHISKILKVYIRIKIINEIL